MKAGVEAIPLLNLALAFVPVSVVVVILFRWAVNAGSALYALSRMLLQLMLIGYFLTFIFDSQNAFITLGVLTVMLLMASWIALRPMKALRAATYPKALAAIAVGGLFTLVFITQPVLRLTPWFEPSKVIPLAGMIFSNAMTSVSLAIERFGAETSRGKSYEEARHIALNASLIPITNSLFAVGLVSIPGMMTGQILSGVGPLIAARYQIMVMCMVFASAGISSACFLRLIKPAGSGCPSRC
ncbi:MAG: ABC transporter permease [Kiritimatiellae bacterium]|nr:ABC transporter permease [Kiritimatiellia bacterium]